MKLHRLENAGFKIEIGSSAEYLTIAEADKIAQFILEEIRRGYLEEEKIISTYTTKDKGTK